MDVEVANTQMPDEYKDFKLQILCKDCHKVSLYILVVLLHYWVEHSHHHYLCTGQLDFAWSSFRQKKSV